MKENEMKEKTERKKREKRRQNDLLRMLVTKSPAEPGGG